ncbi:MAG: 30S ribosomal protein S20 [Sphaerochaetaceae bacterium]|nr:30S ribosomal protein S20 [Sphaerochaetaceae bacterium]
MANNRSAKKRIKISDRNNKLNSFYKSRVKSSIKKYLTLVQDYKITKSEEIFLELQTFIKTCFSQIDKAAKKNVYHKNVAARKKATLTRLYNDL